MLVETAAVAETRHYKIVRAHPGPADSRHLMAMLAGAQRPLLLLGGGGWDQSACADGCFLMYGQELATAMKYSLPIIILVVNNFITAKLLRFSHL
jgi:thiamine pyrophosphate-dependent acetolactate synthase large subunit-like protein